MAYILKSLSRLSILGAILLDVVSAGRAGEEQQHNAILKYHETHMLQVENAYLREEVQELRSELRVAASGSFARKRKDSPSSMEPESGHSGSKPRTNHTEVGGSIEDAFKPLQSITSSLKSLKREDWVQILSTDLQDISEAIAQDAANAARTIDFKEHTPKAVQAKPKESKVLIVLSSNSKLYDTRIRWARDTWAKQLPSSQFVVIGDGKAPNFAGVTFHQTRCKPKDPTMGMCCRYAEAVIVAQSIMWQHPEFQWVYMADDDSYIRTSALEHALLTQPTSHPPDRGLVLGSYGCATSNCSGLMCGGSGYAANRWAIENMAAGDPAGFVQEMMRACNRCGGDAVNNKGIWGDAGLSEVMKDRGIEQRTLDGIYGWMLDKSCLEFSLESEKEPLMYHMIRTQPQMELLHRLFAPVEEQTGGSVPRVSSAALDGLGGCVEFQGNVQCAASRDDEDRPWHHGSSLCQRPRMPRLPVLLGVFTLLLLFAIMVTFIWAGMRYHQWEGFGKLQGLKWQSFPEQERSRFR